MKDKLTFSRDWGKLKNDFFLTVRWNDAIYPLKKPIPLMVCGQQEGHCMIEFSVEVKLNTLLTEVFTRYDADCSVEEYYRMMKNWYGRKPNWKAEESMVKLLGAVKVKYAPKQTTLENVKHLEKEDMYAVA